MGVPILILGESGAGKSASLRNFQKGAVLILNVANKPLPFKNDLECIPNADYKTIAEALKEAKYKNYVIDDSQYLLCFELFDKVKEKGYEKFTDLAYNFYSLIRFIIMKTPPECIVYLLHHSEETDSGRIKAKTIGKMLDSQLSLEGLFSIVLYAATENNGADHVFYTQSDGKTPTKTPIGMFKDNKIINDLKTVEIAIREFYDL